MQADEIVSQLARAKVRRAEAGDCWLAVGFSRDRFLFFSWDPDYYGCCNARADEIRELAAIAKSRPPILVAIKSHLNGAELVSAITLDYDRILQLSFRREIGAGIFSERHIVLEASGRYSNLLLTDADSTIIETAKHIYPDDNRYRTILPGVSYVMPPPVAGTPFDRYRKELSEAGIFKDIKGFGRPLIKSLNSAIACSLRTYQDFSSSLDMSYFKQNARYWLIDNYLTAFPVELPDASPIDAENALEASRLAIIAPIINRHLASRKKQISCIIDKLSARVEKKIAERERLAADSEGATLLMQSGRLLLANAHAVKARSESVTLSDWTEHGEIVRVIELDPQKDAVANAERYFARYKKRKKAAELAEKELSKLRSERDWLNEQASLLDCHNDIVTLDQMKEEFVSDSGSKRRKAGKQQKDLPPPHKRFAFDWTDAEIFAGLSAKGNRYVTFRVANPDDIWFHVQGIPGAHVILRINSEPEDDTFERLMQLAASAAAFYSKGRESGRVRVDFTEKKHVRGIPGAGIANVTYREFSTILADVSLLERELHAASQV